MKVSAGLKSSNKLERYLKKEVDKDETSFLKGIGASGVNALRGNTPIRTGATAAGWKYSVTKQGHIYSLRWMNDSHPETNMNVALMLQYGHGTGTGGYVPGIDYINPALNPVYKTLKDHYTS
jgi:hypothetical protein